MGGRAHFPEGAVRSKDQSRQGVGVVQSAGLAAASAADPNVAAEVPEVPGRGAREAAREDRTPERREQGAAEQAPGGEGRDRQAARRGFWGKDPKPAREEVDEEGAQQSGRAAKPAGQALQDDERVGHTDAPRRSEAGQGQGGRR